MLFEESSDYLWTVLLYCDLPTLSLVAAVNRMWHDLLLQHKGLNWKAIAYHQFPHLRVTCDGSAYGNDWKALCKDWNHRNRSGIFSTHIPVTEQYRGIPFQSNRFFIQTHDETYAFSLQVYPFGNPRFTSSYVSVYLKWENGGAMSLPHPQFTCGIQFRIFSSENKSRRWRSGGITFLWPNGITSWGCHEMVHLDDIPTYLHPSPSSDEFTLRIQVGVIFLYCDIDWYESHDDRHPTQSISCFITETVLFVWRHLLPMDVLSFWILSSEMKEPLHVDNLETIYNESIWHKWGSLMQQDRRLRFYRTKPRL